MGIAFGVVGGSRRMGAVFGVLVGLRMVVGAGRLGVVGILVMMITTAACTLVLSTHAATGGLER